MKTNVKGAVKNVEVIARVIRKDGTVEDLGVVASMPVEGVVAAIVDKSPIQKFLESEGVR